MIRSVRVNREGGIVDEDTFNDPSFRARLNAARIRGDRVVIHEVDPSCPTCMAHLDDSMMPSHSPSSRCQSGSYSHCTCDTCF